MTAQFSDHVKYRGKHYDLAGYSGDGLFDPGACGLSPVGSCTACWRGYVCTYAVEGGRLLLDALAVSQEGPLPDLFGVPPAPQAGQYKLFDGEYQGLAHPLAYTGGLLLADGFIQDLYVHMGFHPAWKYREVHELVFRDGKLVLESDRSEAMAELREQGIRRSLEPGETDDIPRWIEKCFDQRYRF